MNKNNKIRVFTKARGSWLYTKYIKVYPDGTQIFINLDGTESERKNIYTLADCIRRCAYNGDWKEIESESIPEKKPSVKKNIPKITGKVEVGFGGCGYYFIINFGKQMLSYSSKTYAMKHNCKKAMNNFLKMFKGF